VIQTLEPSIHELPFFSDLADPHLKLLMSCAENVHFPAQHYIFREGDPANKFYVIRDGLVSVELYIPGRGVAIVQTVGQGEVVGWSWVSPPYRWHFEARTLLETSALVFDANWLRSKWKEDHDFGYEMMKRFADVIATRLDATRLQLLDMYAGLP